MDKFLTGIRPKPKLPPEPPAAKVPAVRKYQAEWAKKYPWQVYDTDTQTITCKVCVGFVKERGEDERKKFFFLQKPGFCCCFLRFVNPQKAKKQNAYRLSMDLVFFFKL